MSLNSLKIATDGYLKRQTKAVLIIAVAGYLNFQGTPVPPPISPADGQFVGGSRTQRDYTWEQQEEDKRRTKIIHEDKVIVEIIKIWATQCQ